LQLDSFETLLEEWQGNITLAAKEIEEVQTAFNNAYMNDFLKKYDAELERFTRKLTDTAVRNEEPASSIVKNGEAEARKELEKLEEELTRKRENLYCERNKIQLDARQNLFELKKLNPELDLSEEKLKAEFIRKKAALDETVSTMRDLTRGFGFIIHFFTLRKLRVRMYEQAEKLAQVAGTLRNVRNRWVEVKSGHSETDNSLKNEWSRLTVELASVDSRLEALKSDKERLVLEGSARNALEKNEHGELEKLIAAFPETTDFEKMRTLKLDFETGLTDVVEMLGALKGIEKGMENFISSVKAVMTEQKTHSAYLKMPDVEIPIEVSKFHEIFPQIASKTKDDAAISKHPREFIGAAAPFLEEWLVESKIKNMFETLGESLKSAVSIWKK
jgi:hypothetical protein